MIITAQALARLVPAITPYYASLSEACDSFDISTVNQQCHLLAQLAVESKEFTAVIESLNYTPRGLIQTFGAGRISKEQAEAYGRIEETRDQGPAKNIGVVRARAKVIRPANQEAIANIVYGGAWGQKNLGNTQPGDGWIFIGRGLPQITGRDNYSRCSRVLYNDLRLINDPTLLEKKEGAALAAGWFWHDKAIGAVAAPGDVRAVTMKWTGWRGVGTGENVSLPRREKWYADFLSLA